MPLFSFGSFVLFCKKQVVHLHHFSSEKMDFSELYINIYHINKYLHQRGKKD